MIFEELSKLGVPVHPLVALEKRPIDAGWTSNPNLIPTCPEGSNVGIRTGATIGMRFYDKYVCAFDMDVKSEAGIKRMHRLLGSDRILEKSGGSKQGLHFIFTSHLPLPSFGDDLYGMNQKYGFKNMAVTPSICEHKYEIFKAGHYYRDEETVLSAWKHIITHPIDERAWLGIMEDLFEGDELNEKLFIYACIPLIVGDEFNRDFFGKVISSLAHRSGFSIEKLSSWTRKLFGDVHPSADTTTVDSIIELYKITADRAESFNLPGFPTMEDMLKTHIPKQRGTEEGVVAAVIFYKELFGRLFGLDIENKLVVPAKIEIKTGVIERYLDTKFMDNYADHEDFCIEENIFAAGSVVLIYGQESTAKSWTAQDATIAASLGESCWGGRYTFKEPMKTLYFYGDKARAIHESKYIGRYIRKGDESLYKIIYTQNLQSDMRKLGDEMFPFDLSEGKSIKFMEECIKVYQPRMIFLDTLGSLIIDADMSKSTFAKQFMSNMRRIAIENRCCIVLIHHSNKQNVKETRGKPVGKDDFQGSKQWSAQADWTLSVYVNKDNLYAGHFRFRKTGILDKYEDFDYEIINTHTLDKHTVELKFTEPTEDTPPLSKLNAEDDRFKILSVIRGHDGINAVDLRKELGVNAFGNMTPSRFQYNMISLRDKLGYTETVGSTRNMIYKLTPAGEDSFQSIKPPININSIPKDDTNG